MSKTVLILPRNYSHCAVIFLLARTTYDTTVVASNVEPALKYNFDVAANLLLHRESLEKRQESFFV